MILITTKKGKNQEGLGITVNSSTMVGSIDEDTMPTYQNEYSAGYGPFYGGPGGRYVSWGGNLAVLVGEDAVKWNWEIMGATNPKEAAEGTIRKKYALSLEKNSVHGSDSLENAKIEIDYFYRD